MTLDQETDAHLDRCREELPRAIDGGRVAFGFDGVVDRVRTVVGERSGPERFERMTGVRAFGERITDSAALDASCSIEWIEEGRRPGGHAAHLGRAFERLGYEPTLIGTFGTPPEPTFVDEYDRARLVSVGEPSTTDAIEFDDGKVMLSETGKLATLDWSQLREAVGLERLASHVDGAASLGVGYWSTIPRLPSILAGVESELWPLLADPPEHVLVDPGDVRRLAEGVGPDARDALAALDDVVPVTVSANRPEAVDLARRYGTAADPDEPAVGAADLRETLEVTRFVVHSASDAVAATADGTAAVAVPRCPDPTMTTSAGDHFNAGLLLAEHTGIGGGAALVVANALAGWFVRRGTAPTYADLVAFVESYDDRFAERGE